MTDSHPPMLIAAPPPGWGAQPVASAEADRLARRGMVLGIVSFFVNPLLLASIIGIVYGRKAQRLGTSRSSEATAGIVLGAISGVLGILSLAVLLPLSLFLQHSAAERLDHAVEAAITTSADRSGYQLSDVTCSVPGAPRAGMVVDCTAQDAVKGPVDITVDFTSAQLFTMQVQPVG